MIAMLVKLGMVIAMLVKIVSSTDCNASDEGSVDPNAVYKGSIVSSNRMMATKLLVIVMNVQMMVFVDFIRQFSNCGE